MTGFIKNLLSINSLCPGTPPEFLNPPEKKGGGHMYSLKFQT